MATGFFIGYLPLAPATFSCLLSVIIWYFLIPTKVVYIMVSIVLLLTAFALSRDLSKAWGSDPRQIVIDEYACFLIPLYFTPLRIVPLLIAVISFRIFDILKPPPLRQLEKVPGGWGIVLDDLGAAIYASIIVLLATRVLNL